MPTCLYEYYIFHRKSSQMKYLETRPEVQLIKIYYVALFAHEKLALLGLSWIALPETYSPRPH